MATLVEFQLLGPMVGIHDGRPLELGRRQERCLLGMLLLEAGRVVTIDRLVSLLWNDLPPASARGAVHSHVARLRAALTPVGMPILTRGAGYLADIDPQAVDVHRFLAMLSQAQNEIDPATRSALLTDALALWRGPLLGDVADDHLRGRLGAGLDEQHLTAQELKAEADLALGRHHQLPPGLSDLVEQHPTRERLVGLLIQARYRSGDVEGALDAYDRLRRVLADRLGVDPGPELREMHFAILNRGPLPSASPTSPSNHAPPRQLPPDLASFTARRDELQRLDQILPAGHSASAVVIAALAGTAGVGKTTLAVHWAHRVSAKFPDGSLYVNLRGFDPLGSAMAPAEAVRGFLDALRVPAVQIPVGLAAQTGLFRSMLTGKRMLILLDNARDVRQVRPLLPSSAGCMVVITSRSTLSGLVALEGAQTLALDLLTHAESRQLLSGRLGAARVEAEPQATDEIIAICAGLPLALVVLAARAVLRPEFSLGALATELRQTSGLDAFAGDGDAAADVRAVFACSYQALDEPVALLFRMLGLHPGPDISVHAAASMAGLPTETVRPLLSSLEQAHLITQPVPGRFVFHDLLRDYARELAEKQNTPAGNRAARARMLDHYLLTAHRADLLLDPHRDPIHVAAPDPGVVVDDLREHDEALGWYGAEHEVLLAVIEHAEQHGFDVHAWQLGWTVANFLERRGHWQDWADTAAAALHAATRLADKQAEARCHRTLARAHLRLGDHEAAEHYLHRTLELCRATADVIGEAYAHLNLNVVYDNQARYAQARDHSQQALDLYQIAGHSIGQALSLNAIGWAQSHLGEHDEALAYCRQSIELHQEVDNRAGEADAWDSIGFIHLQRGEHADAISGYRQALALFRAMDDRYNVGSTLVRLGDVLIATGDADQAREAWQEALKLLTSLGHPDTAAVRERLTTRTDHPATLVSPG